MKEDNFIGKDKQKAISLLLKGEVVAVPTETVYGLAGNGFDIEVVKKIFQLKKRPAHNPLILHTFSLKYIEQYLAEVNDIVRTLAVAFWPGPMSLVLPKKKEIPYEVTGGLETVAVRIPSHPLLLSILRKLPFPLAAPSANIFSSLSPTTATQVKDTFYKKIPYIVKGGRSSIGIESTIIEVREKNVRLLRKGVITKKQIEKVLGEKIEVYEKTTTVIAPGMFEKHYCPKTPLWVGDKDELIRTHRGKKMAVLNFYSFVDGVDKKDQRILSVAKKSSEAAFELYKILYELDQEKYELIITSFFPDDAIGLALNERLSKAASFIQKESLF